jgi:hypothetical protein
MKLLPLCGLALLGASTACSAPTGPRDNHWNIESLGQRVPYHTLGYRPGIDGSYKDFQWRQKREINLTLRRHFMNDNPHNPFQHPVPEPSAIRPPLSIAPDFVDWFHVSSLVWGGVLMGATGTFIPLPVDSLLGLFEEGGLTEFGQGFAYSAKGTWPAGTPMPPDPADFRVVHDAPRRDASHTDPEFDEVSYGYKPVLPDRPTKGKTQVEGRKFLYGKGD